MLLNLDVPVLTIEGKEFEPPTTLRAALFSATTTGAPGDERLSMEDKLKLHRLAKLVSHAAGPTLELTVEQVADLKKRCGVLFSIHFLGQVVDLLEGPPPV